MLLRPFVFLFFLLSPYIFASEVWRTPLSTWTEKDFQQLLTESPWALVVNATMDDPADKPEYATGVPIETSQAGLPTNARLGASPRWDGSISKNRMGHLATIPVTVRWDSASIVRKALEHVHDSAAALNAAAPTDFIITVTGLLPAQMMKAPATLKGKSSSDDSAAPRTSEENLEWFMANSHLVAKGLPSLQPHNVTIDADSGAVHLFFKRADELESHKRDVFFVTRFGAMSVQAKFRTKDMTLNGQPDL